MMKKNYIAIAAVTGVLLILLAVAAVKNRQAAAPSPSGKIRVTTSFYPLWFFAQRIGGDKADVMNVTPASAEPHDYEPTAQDIARIEDSRMLVLNGGGLEAWGNDITQNVDPARTLIVTAGEGLADRQVEEGGKRITDPHVWLSPPLAEKMADRIAQGFEQIDPANAAEYQSNAKALKADLDELNNAYTLGLRGCERKDIVISHAAFGYLGAAYGLNQVPIAGLSPDFEPSPQQLADTVSFVKRSKVTVIFFESLASPKLSQTIAAETGARTMVLNPIEGLTAEELSQGKDYFTEMRSNLDHLRTALQCTK